MTKMNWKKVTLKEKIKQRRAEHDKHKMEEEAAQTNARIKEAATKALERLNAQAAPAPSTNWTQRRTAITSQAELITPELATKWLEGHTHNRALTHTKAMTYARDMKEGKWDLNGEPIIFDWDGTLQDGQHRLWGCIEVNTEFWSMVTRGVDPATFVTIDTGKSRNAGDVMSIEKLSNHSSLAAAARLVMGYWRGEMRANYKYTNREMLAFVKANPTLGEWVAESRAAPRIHAVTSHLAAVLFVGSQTYEDQAHTFLRQFKTGENLTVGSPILTIRNRIFTEQGFRSVEKLELIVRAWNAFIENRILLKAQIAWQGVFPKIKGDLRT